MSSSAPSIPAENPFDPLSADLDADILLYCGPIQSPHDRELLDILESRQLKRNVLLWLTTLGGDPHAAYRIARIIQRFYNTGKGVDGAKRGTFTVFVDSICKSGGTIVVLGADKLIMSNYAELGPIDLQIRKPDEIGERSSSLTPMQSLGALQSVSSDLFKYHFNRLRMSPEWNFTTRTAADIATKMVIGLMEPIYSQLDPIRLGEIDRFIKVSLQYGERLDSGNLKDGAVEKLVGGYPSHSFVIDRKEAQELFKVVEDPSGRIEGLSTLRSLMDDSINADNAIVRLLNSPKGGNTQHDQATT